ncbi:MAG: nitronate monooxygenase [Bacteroidetes bacterium]|nr:nitronate monooxygenase [Bacteroidota bacterium]MBS1540610.1 nitronate monooxygenase [Bacteroidota bacterium]
MAFTIQKLFNIQYPIVQAGMVWCSGWRLASAVSNAGGLGLIGAGSMRPEVLKEHIQKCKNATANPFGVNVPLLYPEIEKLMTIIASEQVKIVFTSAGNPKAWTGFLKDRGVTVVHVVSSSRFAKKSEEAGVDAVVAEGFEAGGHNGREETTTLCLMPLVRDSVKIPVIAAGGIASGRAMLAAEALGADGVQVGTRFAASAESSAHENYKRKIVSLAEGETMLSLKQLTPVRLIKNNFYQQVAEAEKAGASAEELKMMLGKGRAKRGIFEGDLDEGELEVGQGASFIKEIEPAAAILRELWNEYLSAKKSLQI